METTITQRIKQVLKFFSVSENSLANQMKVSQTTVNSALKPEKDSVSSKILAGVCTKFPNLNVTWLLTGEGEMLNGAPPAGTEEGVAARLDALERKVAELREETAALRAMLAAASEREGRLLSIIDRLTTPAAAPALAEPCKKLTPAEA